MILLATYKHQGDEMLDIGNRGRELSIAQEEKSFIQGMKSLVAVHNKKASAVEPSV